MLLSRCHIYGMFIVLFALSCISACRKTEQISTADLDERQLPPELSKMNNRGLAFLEQKKTDSALFYFQLMEQKSRGMASDVGIGTALIYYGRIAFEAGNTDSAFIYYRQALPFCLRAPKKSFVLPVLYINLGTLYNLQYNYQRSNFYNYLALQLMLRHTPDNPNIAAVYVNLSGIQVSLEQYRQALHYAHKAEQYIAQHPQQKSPYLTTGVLNNKGEALMGLKRYDEAFSALIEGLKIARSGNVLYVQPSLFCSLAELMLMQNRNQEAIAYAMQALSAKGTSNPYYTEILSRYNLGIAYYNIEEYHHAKRYLLESIGLASQTGKLNAGIKTHTVLALVYQKLGDYRQAFTEQQIVSALSDSVMNKEKINAINEMEIKYKSTQKDKEIVEKKLQISRQQNKLTQKNIWMACISFGALLLGSFFWVRFKANRQQQEQQAAQIHILQQQQELLVKESEIKYLKAIVQGEEKERVRIARDLHDGIVSQLLGVRLHFKGALQNAGNTLPNIAEFKNTLHYLDETTKELRKTTHNLMPEAVLQGGLLVALHGFCKKMEEATTTRIHFQNYGHLERNQADMELSVYRIVQELIQNALKHAHASYILVQLEAHEQAFSVTVEDNGWGCPAINEGNKKGLGLWNVHTRVKALNGNIKIASVAGTGTSIHIEFPGWMDLSA